jgi:hypothetical protein
VLLLLPHLLGPVIIYLTQKQPAYPEFHVVRTEQLPPAIAASFTRTREVLAGLGFEAVACLYAYGLATNVMAFMLLMVNRETNEGALATDLYANSGVPTRRSSLEFSTDLASGVEICTTTGKDPNPYKSCPEKLVYKFPEVKNPWALCNLHRQMVKLQVRAGDYSYLPTAGTEIQALSTSFTKTLMRQVEFGYMYLDEAAGVFRPTVKGAIIMTWKLAWPAGMIMRALIRRRARSLMSRYRHALAYHSV